MSCVNCSTAIENGMINEFKNKGLVYQDDKYQVSVVLLMHKMKITFDKETASAYEVNVQSVIEEVECLGFGAELINEHKYTEPKNDEQLRSVSLIVQGMTCASCVNAIQRHLVTLEGVKSCNVSLLTNRAVVEYDAQKIGPRQLIQEIDDIGFVAELQVKDDGNDVRTIAEKEVS